jgi:hypothetical protein
LQPKLRDAALRAAPQHEAGKSRRTSSAKPALFLDEARDIGNAVTDAQVRHHERSRAAHFFRVALHHVERSADVGREIDLVDDQEIGAGDAGATLGGNLVAGGDVDDIDREIGKLG